MSIQSFGGGCILCLTLYKIILGCSPASTPLNGTPPGSLEAPVPGFYKKKEDEEPVFFPGSSKKKSSKKGGGGGRNVGDHRRLSLRKSLSHSPEIFGQFARLSLAPPANLAELDSVLEQLRARHKLYQRLAEQELNSRLGGAQRPATNLDIPAIVVEATANISLEDTPSIGPRPVLLFGEAAPSSTMESGKVVHQSVSTSFSLSALSSSSLETESACCDWPQLSCSRSGGGSVPPSSSPVLTASVASSLSLLSLSSEIVRPSSLLSTPPLIPTNEESSVSQSLVQSAISPLEDAPPGSPAVKADSCSVLPSSSPSVDGPVSQAVVLNGPLITPDDTGLDNDSGDTVEDLPCPSFVLSSPENEDSSCVVVDSCCLDTVSDCTPDAHPSVAASGSQTVKDASAGPLSPSPRYRPSLSLDLGGKMSPLMAGNGETSPLIGNNGETSPLMGGNGETSTLMSENGETSPLIGDNGETSPLMGVNSRISPRMAGNGETSPPMVGNGETSPLMAGNDETSPLMDDNGEESPLISDNGEITSPLMGGNGETSPLMGDNGETSPLMGGSSETSPLIDGNGETSPLRGGNCETSPLMGGNGETSPLMADNGETSPLMGDNGETSPLMGDNGVTSPLMGDNGDPSPLMGGNGETSPLMGGNGEPAKEILQEPASPPCSDPALTQ
jgi:hypothetical protein